MARFRSADVVRATLDDIAIMSRVVANSRSTLRRHGGSILAAAPHPFLDWPFGSEQKGQSANRSEVDLPKCYRNQSTRSATDGSMLRARHAGPIIAKNDENQRQAATPANIAGS
jgi:hypothetical protein